MRPALLASLVLLAVVAPVALAHPERQAHFPDGSVGAVPKYRSTAGQVLVVCKPDSARRIRRTFRPACPGSSVFSPGVATKTASQATCATWDPYENPDPPGCDWFVRPSEPR